MGKSGKMAGPDIMVNFKTPFALHGDANGSGTEPIFRLGLIAFVLTYKVEFMYVRKYVCLFVSE